MSRRILPEIIKVRQRDKSYKETNLIVQFPVNDHFQIGVYQGTLPKSPFDILIRYKQLINGKWTNPRTPKHIHWTVDILIKQNECRDATNQFLDCLLEYWNNVVPLNSEEDRRKALNVENLLDQVNAEAERYQELSEIGEYSIEFLILLAKLLMIQEKTNNQDAFMFKKILEKLKVHSDIFSIVSTATHR